MVRGDTGLELSGRGVFVKISASFSLVSTRQYGICVIRILKFIFAVFLSCPSIVLLPLSTANRGESVSVLPVISGCINFVSQLSLGLPLHRIRAPVLPSQHDQPFTITAKRSKARVAEDDVLRDESPVVRDVVFHVSHDVFELLLIPIVPLVQVSTNS